MGNTAETLAPLAALLAAHPAATDVHLTEGGPAYLREEGTLRPAGDLPDLFPALEELLPPAKRALWEHGGAGDGAFALSGVRCRLHLYRAGGRKAAAIRFLPSIASLPPDRDGPWIEDAASLSSGLVLVTGPAGSGKSTTLARLILAAARAPRHILTIEDPPEYLFPSGVKEALREDPDILVIGELRDAETMAAALTAAETGHLVLSTLHNDSAAGAIGRLVHAFPAEKEREVRALLASVLRTVAAQKLCRIGRRTFLLREILTNIPAAAHLIREGKDEQLLSYMEMGRHHMRTMKQALSELLWKETLSSEEKEQLRQKTGL